MIDKGYYKDIPQLAKPKGNERQGFRGDDAYGGGRDPSGPGPSGTGNGGPTGPQELGMTTRGPKGPDDRGNRQQNINQRNIVREARARQFESNINRPNIFDKIGGIPNAFRISSLKNLYDQKMGLKQFSPSIFGTIANITNPQLSVYEATDPTLDQYGMTGKDLTDIDRLANAINTAETQGITQRDFNDAFFGKTNPRNPNNITQTGGGDGGGITTLPYMLPMTPQAVQQEELVEESPFYQLLRRNLGLV